MANKTQHTSVNKQWTLILLLKSVSLLITLTLKISVLITRLRFMQNFQGFLLHSNQQDNKSLVVNKSALPVEYHLH